MTEDVSLAAMIARQPFFEGLSAPEIQALAGCARKGSYAADDYLIRQHQDAETFQLILKGHVQLTVSVPGKGRSAVETLRAGDALGWSWFVPPHVWHFDARAVEPTETILFDAGCLRELMDHDPAVGYAVLRRLVDVMAQRISSARFQMLDVYGPKPGAQR